MASTKQPRPVSLLETILSDAALIERLNQSQSVSLTLTLELDSAGKPRIDHPDLIGHDPSPVSVDESYREGFVPQRQVVAPGEKPTEKTDYRLVGTLGSGGTGIVYQAHQRAIDREVAVKVLRDELAGDPLSRRRFLQEARTLGSLDHPNVIALHELGSGPDGGLFYSMKRIDGTSWDASIDSMPFAENIDVVVRISNALRYAHSRGLIHRDIKPENVMIGPFGEVLVADWGLALSFAGDYSRRVQTNQSIGGTPAYMAPELAGGDHLSQTVQTDVYLLGAVLFRILTGRPPHHGETLLDCIRNAAANKIVDTHVRNGWMDVAMRAMATEPADRYDGVAGFLHSIEQQRQHQQSDDLLRRATRAIRNASGEVTHQDYSVAEALVRESLDLWPENREAARTLTQLQVDHASAAAANGDFDLALSLLEGVGMGDSELAVRVRLDRSRLDDQASREAKFSALFTMSPDAGLLTRATTGEIIDVNRQFEKLTGYAAEEVVGQRILVLQLWACPQRREVFVADLMQSGYIEGFETPLRQRDGSILEASLSATRLRVIGDDMVLTTIRDISSRKEVEAQLARSRERLADLQRLAQFGSWEMNVKTGDVLWSEETFRIAGRPMEHGSPNIDEYLQTVHPEDRERLDTAIQNSIRYKSSYEVRLRQRLPDGTFKPVIARGRPYLDANGEVTELYGIVIDASRGL